MENTPLDPSTDRSEAVPFTCVHAPPVSACPQPLLTVRAKESAAYAPEGPVVVATIDSGSTAAAAAKLATKNPTNVRSPRFLTDRFPGALRIGHPPVSSSCLMSAPVGGVSLSYAPGSSPLRSVFGSSGPVRAGDPPPAWAHASPAAPDPEVPPDAAAPRGGLRQGAFSLVRVAFGDGHLRVGRRHALDRPARVRPPGRHDHR